MLEDPGEVLLLYNNHIVVVDRNTFEDMAQLQKLYLSQNLTSHFPLELIKGGNKLPKSTLLDLSSNKLKKLPLTDLQKLQA
jgi:Leucine-rich repeat (LRR) protein